MINLKDIAQYTIDEGLLDDIEDNLSAGDKAMDIQMAQDWAKHSRKKVYISKQKKGLVLVGDFVIDDIEDIKYSGTPIKRFTGSLSISGCSIENLEGLFTQDCEIDGSLTIEDCPNFTSLKGCPLSCKTLTISGCKKLKNIDVFPVIYGNLYLYDNGKKFKEEKLRENPFCSVGKKIFCSELFNDEDLINEDEIKFVFEAFKAPQLKHLADEMNKVKVKGTSLDFRRFMGNVQLDKVKSSSVHEYDLPDPKAIPAIKPYTSGKRPGFFYIMDANGNVTYLYANKSELKILDRSEWSKIDNYTSFYNSNLTYIENRIKLASTLVIVDLEGYESTWELKNVRSKTKEGATALMRGTERTNKITGMYWNDQHNKITKDNVRYFQEIADQNRKRYRIMLNKLKAERAAKISNFEKYKTEIDKLFTRYTNLLSKIIKDPTKYSTYDIEFLNDRFKCAYNNGTGRNSYIKESGLFVAIEKYFEELIRLKKSGTSSYNTVDIENTLKTLEYRIESNIKDVDSKLTELENK